MPKPVVVSTGTGGGENAPKGAVELICGWIFPLSLLSNKPLIPVAI